MSNLIPSLTNDPHNPNLRSANPPPVAPEQRGEDPNRHTPLSYRPKPMTQRLGGRILTRFNE